MIRTVALLALLLAIPVSAQTVDEVIALHEAGLSEATIATQIRTMGTIYSLDNAALIKLKKADVPETLIQSMIRTAGAVSESPAMTTSAAPASRADAQATELKRSMDTYSNVYGSYPANWYWSNPYYSGYAPRLGLYGSYYGYPYFGHYSYGRHYGYGYRGYRSHRGHHGFYSPGIIYRGSNFSFAFGTNHYGRHRGGSFFGFRFK